MKKIVDKMKSGSVSLVGLSFAWKFERKLNVNKKNDLDEDVSENTYRLHLGPGPNWVKPDKQWVDVDIDPGRGDLVVDFQDFEGFPLRDSSTECIYGSHVFEHMSIWVTDKVFSECNRVLKPGGIIRLVLPDVEKSIREYIAGNADFRLFKRRRERAMNYYGVEYTLFDCLREDFLSRSGQQALLGERALAHQNAWDFDSISNDLRRAGFAEVYRSAFTKSRSPYFGFEGTYECEALEEDRSLYVEAVKM